MKAAIDGKKVRPTKETPIEYVYFHCGNFIIKWNNGVRDYGVPSYADWQIVPEYVDFAEAWKAYEEGKTVHSVFSDINYNKHWEGTKPSHIPSILTTEIRGEWIILEQDYV